MKKFISLLSENFGYIVIIILTVILTFLLSSTFNFNGITRVIIACVLYFVLWNICTTLIGIIFSLTVNKYYKLAILLSMFIFLYDIEFFVKFIVIINKLKFKKDLETIQNYFYDNDQRIQYISLSLYADIDVNPVNKWYEDNYISKNIPIDSYFYDIYASISNPE